jgi:hypothetical protein
MGLIVIGLILLFGGFVWGWSVACVLWTAKREDECEKCRKERKEK